MSKNLPRLEALEKLCLEQDKIRLICMQGGANDASKQKNTRES